MQRGMQVIYSRRRMEAKPRSESGTICRGVLGKPKRSSRTFCASRRRGKIGFTIPFDLRQERKRADRYVFLIFNRNKGSLKLDRSGLVRPCGVREAPLSR